MGNITNQILNKLYEAEESNNVTIIFAIESGSRGWGFESPDSDYDCRFVYVNKKDCYLSIMDKKDIIEYEVDEVFDVSGWDLKKFITLLTKSNVACLEWLSSDVVYIKNEKLANELQKIADEYFNPVAVIHHYLSMAKKKYESLAEGKSNIKTYFYILRPLACVRYIYEHKKMPNMNYFENLDKIQIDKEVLDEINKLYKLKISVDEKYKINKNDIIFDYFTKELNFFEQEIKTLNTKIIKIMKVLIMYLERF